MPKYRFFGGGVSVSVYTGKKLNKLITIDVLPAQSSHKMLVYLTENRIFESCFLSL